MLRKIKFKVIREVSEELKQEINELRNDYNKFKTDVLKINGYYEGKDADIIISKYETRIKYLEEYIKIIEVYNNYFEWISGAYDETHKKALTNLQSVVTDAIENMSTLNIGTEGGINGQI